MIYTYTAVLLLCCYPVSGSNIAADDFRIIHREDLLSSNSDVFYDNETISFSQMLFDVARDQVIVGARDMLYRLSLKKLTVLEQSSWPAPSDRSELCQNKGQAERDCHNFIKVLLSSGERLLACGTNAFSPLCSWREMENVNNVTGWVHGIAKCPHNPKSNVTALLTHTGQLYAGTPTDFASSDTAIYRINDPTMDQSNTLRTIQYDSIWLNDPQFVGSFDDDKFVYFVFREVAVEYMNCGKIIYSRIARVCKNDVGGQLVLKNSFTTYTKARLNCSLPGEYPFYYDEIQAMTYLPDERLLFATFSTPRNGIAGSAVCVYNMSAIEAAFRGPFKYQSSPTSGWESVTANAHSNFECEEPTRSHREAVSRRYQLMNDAIQPITTTPLHHVSLERYAHLAVDTTLTRYRERTHVLFLATDGGDVMKLSVLAKFKGSCLVELWRLSERGNLKIESMAYLEETNSLYLSTSRAVLRIAVQRCNRHRRRTTCVGSADPYCGWDDARDVCTTVPESRAALARWTQEVEGCPVIDIPADGGWSSWSKWEVCLQDTDQLHDTNLSQESPDKCLCKTRVCNNPAPMNGGAACSGVSVLVRNCTLHGGWTAWSAWSACSASCGIAVKTRRRWCAAPAPAHGGRLCVGQDSNEIYCSQTPPCPDPTPAARDGGWSSWSAWSTCVGTAPCGGTGRRERARTCTAPLPAHGGAECDGDAVERQSCELPLCEYRRVAAWTPWLQVAGNESEGSVLEKRFKYLCKAQTMEPIKLSIVKEEERYCTGDGTSCTVGVGGAAAAGGMGGGWGVWGAWGPCSTSCGRGQQARVRSCLASNCLGSGQMTRPCNVHACSGGAWSCWSEWSPCSSPCSRDTMTPSSGWRERTRTCLNLAACEDDLEGALQRETCIAESCEDAAGWGEWGAWATCSEVTGEQIRRRGCLTGSCSGKPVQIRKCVDDDLDNELNALPVNGRQIEMASIVSSSGGLGLGALLGLALVAFLTGCGLALLAAAYWTGRHEPSFRDRFTFRRKPRVPSSPHYITAKQNSYVTVPLKDVPRKAKRQPSFTGICSSSGAIVLSKSNNLAHSNTHHNALATPKLYPKAIANEYDAGGTLKRHSHQPKNNIDLDEEKFY